MDKNDKRILVVAREHLFSEQPAFQGFQDHVHYDYEAVILNHSTLRRRGDVEEDPFFKQPIAYSLIVNPSFAEVFVYQRASHHKDYGEKRLQGKWSLGVGGHIEQPDLHNGNPIRTSSLRELQEEVSILGSITLNVLGYINDDANPVGQVHFGILYLLETNARTVVSNSPEMANGALYRFHDLTQMCSSPSYDFEEWSRIALEPLKSYFLERAHSRLEK